jgi:aminopeptidase YwaD
MRRVIISTALVLTAIRAAPATQSKAASAPDPALPASAERAYAAVSARFDRNGATGIVEFMDRFWRVAANPGYNASIERIRERLEAAGFGAPAKGGIHATLRVDEFPNRTPGWDHQAATVTFADGSDREPLFSRDRDRVALCINSFGTPEGGFVAPLVDVGRGAADADYTGKNLKGAIVLGDATAGRLWQQAVRLRGAAGVISTDVARYIRPADPAQFTRDEQKDVFQWGSIPYDTAARSFGFKASWRAAQRMRERLRGGPVSLKAQIQSTFHPGPNRSLVAEIVGRQRPHERIVMVAHVQEPGANDNASGSATQYGLARALLEAIRAGAIAPPSRTLTFMWVDEIRGSRQWLTSRPDEAKGVKYMFALDMTGEDVTRTGGTFLIEKQADPSAVWTRPSDPHSEWGAGGVKPEALKGSLLNDLHLAVCLRRARDTGWIVKTNPYEGGSDHTVFAEAGFPSLLNWHFTDRYYHTNQDRADKVSAAEMENVGLAVATSAWFLASSSSNDAESVLELLGHAARRRLALERVQGAALVASAPDRAAAERVEAQVHAAWVKWYDEAMQTVLELSTEEVTTALRARVDRARSALRAENER